MPISSVSKVFDATDPILENDLELLGKVNTYQQAKFDQGADELQQEVNNWSLMTNIAKPELRDYANKKLNNLVKGIQNLGGVNLLEKNNVNSLKSLGYNIYGDERIRNGIVTTRKMQSLASSIQSSLNGKDAGKYDPVLGEYLMKGYQQWSSDGNVDSKYDGPSVLPQGSMNTINKKVSDYLKELKPDADNFPVGVDPKSLGYFQMGNKWLSQSRINEAISAVTDENDQQIFRAHGWKGLSAYDNRSLIIMQSRTYDYANSQIKSDLDRFKMELSQTKDTDRKLQLNDIITQKENTLKDNEAEKLAFVNKTDLTPDEREYIQSAIYSKAWKDNVINANSFRQEDKKLILNPVVAFQSKEERLSKEFAANYNFNTKKFAWEQQMDKANLDLKQKELDLKEAQANPFGSTGIGGPIQLQKANTVDKENEVPTPAPLIENFKSAYYDTHAQYYQKLYKQLAETDASKFNYDTKSGVYTPKPEFAAEVDKELNLFEEKISNYPRMTDAEKKSLNLPVDEQELNEIFALKKANSLATAYYNMARTKEDEIINYAKTNNLIKADWRDSKINLGASGGVKTIEEALATYNNLSDEGKKAMDNIELKSLGKEVTSWLGNQKGGRPAAMAKNRGTIANLIQGGDPTYTFQDLREEIVEIKDGMTKAYQKAGGKVYNSYETVLPFKNLNTKTQDLVKRELFSIPELSKGDVDAINPLSGSVVLDGTTGGARFKMKVQTGSGKKLKTEEVDVTDLVKNSNNSLISQMFPKNNTSLVFGMYLSNNGSTPFTAADNYKSSLKTTVGNYPYQVIRSGDKGGTEYFKVKLMYPIGGGKTIAVDVKNMYANDSYRFDPYMESIDDYFNQIFSNPDATKLFKEKHNLK